MTEETNLKLGDIVIPVGAGRGITQNISLVDNGDLRRTVNGTLIDLTRDETRKYTSSVQSSDQKTPSLAGIWKGQELVVECISTIRQLVSPASTSVTLIRDFVTGSVFGRDINGAKVTPSSNVDLAFTFPTNIVMVEWLPKLTMLVADINIDSDEYEATQGWSINLEEV